MEIAVTDHLRGTALAAPQEQPSQYLAAMERITNLTPATKTEFRNQLTACLVLTAPSGMTEEARSDWLRVAWMTLSHLPSDLLERGCKKARETADHPAKIVPIIMKEVEDDIAWRKRMQSGGPSRSYYEALTAEPTEPEKPNYCTPDEARTILEEIGFRTKWRVSDDI